MNKKFLIYGASGDIGSACAIQLAGQFPSLVLVGHTQKAIDQIASKLHDKITDLSIYKCDMKDADELTCVTESIKQQHPTIDGIVFAAGIPGNRWEDLSLDRWHTSFAVNVDSLFVVIKLLQENLAFSPYPSIVAISSIAGERGYYKVDYAVTKAAVNAFIKSLAIVLGPKNIRVNCVAPGPVEGRLTASWDRKRKENAAINCPLKRLARPQDIAVVVDFLLSKDASFVNGAIIDVSGGLSNLPVA